MLGLTQVANSQQSVSIDFLLNKAKNQVEAFDEQEAIKTYQRVLKKDPDNFEALWNVSVMHSSVGRRLDTEDEQSEYYRKAVDYAEKAVQNYPEKGLSYYAMAVAKARTSKLKGNRERIRLSHEVLENIKKAVDMMPEHALSWHLYGVWQSEVANVGRIERFAAKFISKGIPDASNEKAEEYLKKAIELNPGSVLIRFDLAMHYMRSDQEDRAIPVIEELLTIEPELKDGKLHMEEAKKLLNNLKT